MAGLFRTLRFAFKKVSKRFLVVRATLKKARLIFHRSIQPARREHIDKNSDHLGAHQKQVEIKRLFPP